MDCNQYTTIPAGRKKGQHLQREERGAIQYLKSQGLSNRAIARELGCSPTTVGNELRRGTPPRKSCRGRAPSYSARLGETVYKANRGRCRKPHKVLSCIAFLNWATSQIRSHKWSLDSCVGKAKLYHLFPSEEIICTRTFYNEVWAGTLSLSVIELPQALKCKRHKAQAPVIRKNRRILGNGISERPKIAELRIEEGHWEGDTVVGKRAGKEAVIFSMLEKKTRQYLAIRIPRKDAASVLAAMQQLKDEYGDHFAEVFKTITVDNGSEFSDFAQVEAWGCKVFFAHPYTSWERSQNERHNGLFRAFVPKGTSIEEYSPEEILHMADELNGRPRKKLGYRTPEELYEAFLDRVYARPKN